ncbi:integrase core domain-containing protein [Streptomyces sp. NPDC007983]|uniref:integrase core domain-containing protein n=1 Tax=Streptomyces sp. NPDC007983 TaxID=3364800 RepID=UPI0036EF8DA3
MRHRLTPDEAAGAFALAKACAEAYPNAHDEGFLADAPVLAHDLPPSVRRAANAARLDDRKHAFVVSGNTVEPWLEPTPAFWRDADTVASGPYGFLLVLYAALLGDPIGWRTQQDGRIVTDGLPVRGLEHSLVSASSERELGWHTEDAFSENRADHVGLFCLRDRGDIPTTLSCADPASLPQDVVRVLAQKRFTIHPDPSHSTPADTRHGREKVALLSGPGDAPVLRIDRDFTVADEDDPEAVRAMKAHIDTVLLQRWFVLFFIDHGTRRVHIAGITRHPTGPWITQQARNYLMDLGDHAESIKFLIRDRGAYFTDSFDAVFEAIGAHVLPTLPRVPRMNAIAERWIGSCRREATDRILITGERHLRLVIDEYAKHYNQHRPHQSLGQQAPDRLTEPGPPTATDHTRVLRLDRLGGLIHEYTQVA